MTDPICTCVSSGGWLSRCRVHGWRGMADDLHLRWLLDHYPKSEHESIRAAAKEPPLKIKATVRVLHKGVAKRQPRSDNASAYSLTEGGVLDMTKAKALDPEWVKKTQMIQAQCNKFLAESHKREEVNPKGWRHWLKLQMGERFPEDRIEGKHPRLLEFRIAYNLLEEGYKLAGVMRRDIPDRMRENIQAAEKMDVESFHSSVKSVLEAELTAPNQPPEKGESNQDMATKEKEKPRGNPGQTGKSSGMKMHEFWVKLFAKNKREKLTDEQLAKEMRGEFPNAKRVIDVALVRSHRSIYNAGKFPEQGGKAPDQLVPFDAEGKELPLRYREGAVSAKRAPKVKRATAKVRKTKKAAVRE